MYKQIPGIYIITCTANGDRYIGSTKSTLSRRSDHWISLRKNKHHNRHLQAVWNKYGESSFVFELIERVDDLSCLLEREQYWIDTLKPELNKAIKAESGFLGLKHSKETIQKLSGIQKNRLKSPELIERLRQAAKDQNARQTNGMRGKHISEDVKQKLRAATQKQFSSPEGRQRHLDAMKKWMTPDMREQISKAKKGVKRAKEAVEASRVSLLRVWNNYTDEERKRRVEKTSAATTKARAKRYKGFVSPDGIVYRDVYNLAEFCREHGLRASEMSNIDKGKKKSHKGWRRL